MLPYHGLMWGARDRLYVQIMGKLTFVFKREEAVYSTVECESEIKPQLRVIRNHFFHLPNGERVLQISVLL